jgi:hypothetical protein
METELKQGHEDIILHDNTGKYDAPWIREYVIEERNRKKTWEEIAAGIRERGMPNITAQKCSTIWKASLARTMVTSTEAKEDFIEFTQQLKGLYGDAIMIMGGYTKTLRGFLEILEKKKEELEEIGGEDMVAKILELQINIAKTIPLTTGLMKEIREYVKSQISLYDTIQKTGEEDIIFSESKILEYYNQFEPTRLKQLEEQGDIKILNKQVLKQ